MSPCWKSGGLTAVVRSFVHVPLTIPPESWTAEALPSSRPKRCMVVPSKKR
jgi:hypothetical protein